MGTGTNNNRELEASLPISDNTGANSPGELSRTLWSPEEIRQINSASRVDEAALQLPELEITFGDGDGDTGTGSDGKKPPSAVNGADLIAGGKGQWQECGRTSPRADTVLFRSTDGSVNPKGGEPIQLTAAERSRLFDQSSGKTVSIGNGQFKMVGATQDGSPRLFVADEAGRVYRIEEGTQGQPAKLLPQPDLMAVTFEQARKAGDKAAAVGSPASPGDGSGGRQQPDQKRQGDGSRAGDVSGAPAFIDGKQVEPGAKGTWQRLGGSDQLAIYARAERPATLKGPLKIALNKEQTDQLRTEGAELKVGDSTLRVVGMSDGSKVVVDKANGCVYRMVQSLDGSSWTLLNKPDLAAVPTERARQAATVAPGREAPRLSEPGAARGQIPPTPAPEAAGGQAGVAKPAGTESGGRSVKGGVEKTAEGERSQGQVPFAKQEAGQGAQRSTKPVFDGAELKPGATGSWQQLSARPSDTIAIFQTTNGEFKREGATDVRSLTPSQVESAEMSAWSRNPTILKFGSQRMISVKMPEGQYGKETAFADTAGRVYFVKPGADGKPELQLQKNLMAVPSEAAKELTRSKSGERAAQSPSLKPSERYPYREDSSGFRPGDRVAMDGRTYLVAAERAGRALLIDPTERLVVPQGEPISKEQLVKKLGIEKSPRDVSADPYIQKIPVPGLPQDYFMTVGKGADGKESVFVVREVDGKYQYAPVPNARLTDQNKVVGRVGEHYVVSTVERQNRSLYGDVTVISGAKLPEPIEVTEASLARDWEFVGRDGPRGEDYYIRKGQPEAGLFTLDRDGQGMYMEADISKKVVKAEPAPRQQVTTPGLPGAPSTKPSDEARPGEQRVPRDPGRLRGSGLVQQADGTWVERDTLAGKAMAEGDFGPGSLDLAKQELAALKQQKSRTPLEEERMQALDRLLACQQRAASNPGDPQYKAMMEAFNKELQGEKGKWKGKTAGAAIVGLMITAAAVRWFRSQNAQPQGPSQRPPVTVK